MGALAGKHEGPKPGVTDLDLLRLRMERDFQKLELTRALYQSSNLNRVHGRVWPRMHVTAFDPERTKSWPLPEHILRCALTTQKRFDRNPRGFQHFQVWERLAIK